MQFSSIPTMIDAHLQSQLHNTPLKGASLFLYVAKKNPFILEDNTKIQLTVSEDDLQVHQVNFNKIMEGSNISLENIDVDIEYGKEHKIQNIQLSSKNVIIDVGEKESKLKNFEFKASLQRIDGRYPLAISTYQYIRRLQRQELVKKHYKTCKSDVLNFVRPDKKGQRHREDENSAVSQEVSSLDTESVHLLKKLLKFTDKGQLFRVLLQKPLREKQSKKSVRLSIIPTDVQQDTEGFQIRKKQFNRNTIQQLLGEYEAREQRIRQ